MFSHSYNHTRFPLWFFIPRWLWIWQAIKINYHSLSPLSLFSPLLLQIRINTKCPWQKHKKNIKIKQAHTKTHDSHKPFQRLYLSPSATWCIQLGTASTLNVFPHYDLSAHQLAPWDTMRCHNCQWHALLQLPEKDNILQKSVFWAFCVSTITNLLIYLSEAASKSNFFFTNSFHILFKITPFTPSPPPSHHHHHQSRSSNLMFTPSQWVWLCQGEKNSQLINQLTIICVHICVNECVCACCGMWVSGVYVSVSLWLLMVWVIITIINAFLIPLWYMCVDQSTIHETLHDDITSPSPPPPHPPPFFTLSQ